VTPTTASGNAPFVYASQELDLFLEARHWKAYWRSTIRPFVGGDVLEVGAGIGANTTVLADLSYRKWVCLEPDAALAARITLPTPRHELTVGTTDTIGEGRRFDAILYLDVLEHIEDDWGEMLRAAGLLKPGGRLVVLAPAHMFLYSPFDREIGHFRRYSRASLRSIAPPGMEIRKLVYLDSCGALASFCNRLLLRSPMPTSRQLWTWDHFMVPCSRLLDPLLLHRAGKSVLGIWSRNEPGAGR